MAEGKYKAVIELDDGKRVDGKFEVFPDTHTRYKAEVLNGKLRLRKLK